MPLPGRFERAGSDRSIGRPATWFGLVAGFLEQGEHPDDAVLREVDEELGIEAELKGFLGIYPFERLNQVIFAYHVLGGPGPITLAWFLPKVVSVASWIDSKPIRKARAPLL